jgi:hypothetical protein
MMAALFDVESRFVDAVNRDYKSVMARGVISRTNKSDSRPPSGTKNEGSTPLDNSFVPQGNTN